MENTYFIYIYSIFTNDTVLISEGKLFDYFICKFS